MASTGFTLAGTGADNASAGNVVWTNPGNVTASDDSRATALLGANNKTHILDCTNFGFSLSAGSQIDGIEVRLEKSDDVTATGIVRDFDIRLIKGGTRQGNDKADTATDWLGTDTNVDYGGVADLWGLTLSQADVEATNFGVAIQSQNASGVNPNTARIDAVWINVHYTAAAGFVPRPNPLHGPFGGPI